MAEPFVPWRLRDDIDWTQRARDRATKSRLVSRGVTVQVDVQGIEDTLLAIGSVPKGIDRARRRALAKLATYGKREVARLVAAAIGTTQKRIVALARVSTRKHADGSLEFWIGTNPIAAQYLGKVTWKRSWTGAKAGTIQFPRAWSWVNKPDAKTGAAIMHRVGNYRDAIAEVKVQIHPHIASRINDLERMLAQRFEILLRQELNYALTVEAKRA